MRVTLTEFSGKVLSIGSELNRLRESIEKSRFRKESCSSDIDEINITTEIVSRDDIVNNNEYITIENELIS